MYAAQHAAAASENATPSASAPPCHGSVSSTTPTAASPGHALLAPSPRATATPRGPRNSSAAAVPRGSRASAAMKKNVTPAIATPSNNEARMPERENCARRGRTSTSRSSPAQLSRRHAAPSGPMRTNRPTDAASPSCTQRIAAIAMEAPVRADEFEGDIAPGVNGTQSFASTSYLLTYRPRNMNNSRGMEIRRLKLLLELSRLGSMRAVADTLGYTTSSVSQQLGVLAQEAGAALVEPDGRRVRLTPAGRRLADHAVTILAAVDAARLDLDPGAEPRGTVRVAGFATAMRRSLLPLVDRLRSEHPDVLLRIREHEPDESFALLADDDIDLALVYEYNLAPVGFDPSLDVAALWSVRWALGIPSRARRSVPRGAHAAALFQA